MHSSIRYSFLAALALAFAPGAYAQEAAPAQPQLSPTAQGLIAEVQEIQAALAPVQERAMQDPALQEEQQQVAMAVQQAIVQLDPEAPQRLERAQQLQQELASAQEAGDTEQLGALIGEAQQLQLHLVQLQAEAIQHPEVAPRVEAFQTRLQAKMIELDPEAEARFARLEELDRQLDRELGS